MENLIVKNVDVMGDFIAAAQDQDGNIWVGVRWICDALDMTEGQRKRQIKNIQKDMAFEKVGSNWIPLRTDGGVKEVFCIRNDFVPLWLAKITITEKTREERPDFAKKLLDYQLKAKDILAEAFLPKQDTPPLTLKEQVRTIAQGTAELYERVDKVAVAVDDVKSEIETIKNDLPILPIEADEITKAVRRRGVQVLGGKESPAYNDRGLRQRVYNNLYANLKYNFEGIRSYKAIRRKDTDKAIKIVNEYNPPLFLAEQIEAVNTQQSFDFEGGAGR